jgi:hypothetical protein
VSEDGGAAPLADAPRGEMKSASAATTPCCRPNADWHRAVQERRRRRRACKHRSDNVRLRTRQACIACKQQRSGGVRPSITHFCWLVKNASPDRRFGPRGYG